MGERMNLNLILLVPRPILHHSRSMPMCQGQVARMNLSLLPPCLLLGIVVTACSPSDLDMLLTEQLLEIDLECLLHCHVSEVASCDIRLPSPCMPSRSLRAQTCKHLPCTFSDRPVRASSTVCGSDKRGQLDRFLLCPESRWKMTTTTTTSISATQVEIYLLCLLPFSACHTCSNNGLSVHS